jgi:hypothetical protein
VPVVCMSAWMLAAIIAKGNNRKAKIRRNTQYEQGWYSLALAHPCPILTAPWISQPLWGQPTADADLILGKVRRLSECISASGDSSLKKEAR